MSISRMSPIDHPGVQFLRAGQAAIRTWSVASGARRSQRVHSGAIDAELHPRSGQDVLHPLPTTIGGHEVHERSVHEKPDGDLGPSTGLAPLMDQAARASARQARESLAEAGLASSHGAGDVSRRSLASRSARALMPSSMRRSMTKCAGSQKR